MKRKLLEILACPLCKGDLKLEIMEEDGKIWAGLLTCDGCRQTYPIIDGIPNLLRPKLRSKVALAGIPFGIAEFYILRPDALINNLAWEEAFIPGFILPVGTRFAEEVTFRGACNNRQVRPLGGEDGSTLSGYLLVYTRGTSQ